MKKVLRFNNFVAFKILKNFTEEQGVLSVPKSNKHGHHFFRNYYYSNQSLARHQFPMMIKVSPYQIHFKIMQKLFKKNSELDATDNVQWMTDPKGSTKKQNATA